jgi:hypothetical protein
MLIAFPLLWAAGAIAAFLRRTGHPWTAALAVLPAFLLSGSDFTVGVGDCASAWKNWRPRHGRGAGDRGSSALQSGGAGTRIFVALAGVIAALAVVALSGTLCFRQTGRYLFLIFIAAVWLSRAIPPLYPSAIDALPLGALGQLMWFRTGLFAILSVRRLKNIGFGFWPAPREWKIGALYFAALAPVVAALGWLIHFARPHLHYARDGNAPR